MIRIGNPSPAGGRRSRVGDMALAVEGAGTLVALLATSSGTLAASNPRQTGDVCSGPNAR